MNLSLRKAGTLLVAGLAFAACSTESNDSPLTPPLGMAELGDDAVSFVVCKVIVNDADPESPGIEGVGEMVSFEATPGGSFDLVAANGTTAPVAQCDSGSNVSEEINVPIGSDISVTELAETSGGGMVSLSSFSVVSSIAVSGSCYSDDGIRTATVPNVGDANCTPEAGEPYKLIFKNLYSVGEDETGMDGCTPGAWRNQDGTGRNGRNRWTGTPYDLTTTFESVFGAGSIGDSELTLREALDINSNRDGRALLKHAAAAALNAAHVDVAYPYSLETVVSDFLAAWADLEADDNATKDKFDAANNLGCPI